MGQRSNDPSSTRHRTITSTTTTTMKIAIVSLVLVAAVSVNGGVLSSNGMSAIETIIDNIDDMSHAATDLNTMEKGLEAQKTDVENALSALTDNLNKENLGSNSKNNDHTNKKMEGDNWVDVA